MTELDLKLSGRYNRCLSVFFTEFDQQRQLGWHKLFFRIEYMSHRGRIHLLPLTAIGLATLLKRAALAF